MFVTQVCLLIGFELNEVRLENAVKIPCCCENTLMNHGVSIVGSIKNPWLVNSVQQPDDPHTHASSRLYRQLPQAPCQQYS